MPLVKYAALATGCLLSVNAASGEISEDDFMVNLPTVASATRLSQPVSDSPASITIIDRQMIAASGFIEVPDLFRLVPGFQVGLTWRDHHTAIAYHGQSDGLTRNMQILLDGRIAFGAQFGLVDWDRLGITVNDLERIEVVRGPSGAAYGSNAFSGTINLVTRDIAVSPTFEVATVGGSNQFGLLSSRYSYHGDKLDYRIAVSYFETESFDNINDEVQAKTFSFDGRYQLAEGHSLTAHINFGDGESGRGGQIPLFDPVDDKDVTEQNLLLRWDYAPSQANQFYLQASHIRSREVDRHTVGLLSNLLGVQPVDVPLLLGGIPDGILEVGPYGFDSFRAALDFQHTYQYSPDLRVVWGAGVQEDKVEGALNFIPNPGGWEDVKGRAFANLEKTFDRFSINAGVLFEDGDLANGDLSSRLGVNYHLSEQQTFRLSYAVGYRQPFVGEAYHQVAFYSNNVPIDTFFVTPEVPESEKVIAYELGYVGSLFDGKASLEAKLYREEYTNQIHQRVEPDFPEVFTLLLPGAVTRGNIGATTIEGFEMGLRYRFNTATNLWLSYAYADAKQIDQPGAIRSLLRYNGTPRNTASLLLSHKLTDTWEVSAGAYYLGDMSWLEALTEFDGNFVDSYTRIDARIAKRFELPAGSLLLELIAQNLGDDYSEFRAANLFTTRGFVRASFEFD